MDMSKEQDAKSLPSPKGSRFGQCLCSPTTHQGSFRCRYHRSLSSAWMRRLKSFPSSSKTATTTKPLDTV